jgi:hypothetical protein
MRKILKVIKSIPKKSALLKIATTYEIYFTLKTPAMPKSCNLPKNQV